MGEEVSLTSAADGALPAHPPPVAQPGQLVPAWELHAADFARHLTLSAAERTGRSYLDVLHRMAAFGIDPLEAERADLERFLARPRRGRHGGWAGRLSVSTQTTELAGLRRFYAWAREERLREDDPTQGLRPPRREPYAGARALSAQELAQILAVIPSDHPAGLRLRALILTYLLTGRRRQEVLGLHWRDLDLEGSFYRYRGKGGKERQRVLPRPVRQAIEAYARASGAERRPEDAVFPGRWRDQPVDGNYVAEQLNQAAEVAGVSLERPFHTLRHTYSRTLRQVGASLEEVQAQLDHSNLATTSTYLRMLDGQEDPWWPQLAKLLGLDGAEGGGPGDASTGCADGRAGPP